MPPIHGIRLEESAPATTGAQTGGVGWLFLAVSSVALLLTLNAFRPVKRGWLQLPSFMASWFTVELFHHHVLAQLVIIGVFVALGALDSLAGWVALGLNGASVAGLIVLGAATRRTVLIMRESLAELEPGDDAPRFPRSHVLLPVLATRRRGVRRIRDVEYGRAGGRRLRLDVYLPPRDDGGPRPAVVQIHGGAWVLGDKREQGLPLLNHLAANGWVGFNVNYRLSPAATFPDHLVDCKRAIAWLREHAGEYEVDPGFVAVTGGSAGGHLAAMVALTAGDRSLQPGFEDADTGVQAAVPFYGVYDFTNRLGTMPPEFLHRLIEPWVMKGFLADEPERFAAASPIDRVHDGAPPFLVIHGDRDTLAPVEDARLFVERLRAVSRQPVLYAEMQGAQHAFDVFPSFRSARVIEGVERFLSTLWHAHRDRSRAAIPEDPGTSPPVRPRRAV